MCIRDRNVKVVAGAGDNAAAAVGTGTVGDGQCNICLLYTSDTLLEQHEFHNLKGMIYFTDGFGMYPKKMPPYKTAFVSMQDHYRDVDVPVWAMKLILDEDDFEKPDR